MSTPSSLKAPYWIEFPRIGESAIGYISVLDQASSAVPFPIERIFWTYHTPDSIVRGRHAHHRTEQVMVALAGQITLTLELPGCEPDVFRLDSPNKGLYIPPNAWHTMQYTHTAIQLVFASTHYEESDYIRSYDDFKSIHGE